MRALLLSRDHSQVSFRFSRWTVVATTLIAAVPIARLSSSPLAVSSSLARRTDRVTQVHIPLLRSVSYAGTLGVAGGDIIVGDETSSTVCRLAIVDPVSLKLISNRNTSCTDPSLDGAMVMPVESPLAAGSPIGVVRIATRTSASGAINVGPVVMRYENSSTTSPEWTYGGGYLWLYDVALAKSTKTAPRGAEVVRISLTTGQVMATVTVPSLVRVELAANGDGLWIGRSQETTLVGSKPPALLYFVGVRATKPRVVIRSGDYVSWLAAEGHAAWATLVGADKSGAPITDSFLTPTGKPRVTTLSSTVIVPIETGQESFDAQPVVEDPGVGLFFVTTEYPKSGNSAVSFQQIFTFNPTNGHESKVTSIRLSSGRFQASVVYKGSLYLLTGGGGLNATLFRVSS